MVRFYTLSGTILHFEPEMGERQVEEGLSNFLILKPQWLTKMLGRCKYDIDAHTSPEFELPGPSVEDVDLALIQHFLKDYSLTDKKYLLALSRKM